MASKYYNTEKNTEYQKRYRDSHKEQLAEYDRARHANRTDEQKAADRERQKLYMREYRKVADNKEREKKRARIENLTPEQIERKNSSHKAWYYRYALENKMSRQARRQMLRDIRAESGCMKCGFENPNALHFHHRDPSTKCFTISNSAIGYKLERIMAEIEKCDVLCANCHSLLHAEERD